MNTILSIEARYPSDSPDVTTDDAEQAVERTLAVVNSAHRDLIAHGLHVAQEETLNTDG